MQILITFCVIIVYANFKFGFVVASTVNYAMMLQRNMSQKPTEVRGPNAENILVQEQAGWEKDMQLMQKDYEDLKAKCIYSFSITDINPQKLALKAGLIQANKQRARIIKNAINELNQQRSEDRLCGQFKGAGNLCEAAFQHPYFTEVGLKYFKKSSEKCCLMPILNSNKKVAYKDKRYAKTCGAVRTTDGKDLKTDVFISLYRFQPKSTMAFYVFSENGDTNGDGCSTIPLKVEAFLVQRTV